MTRLAGVPAFARGSRRPAVEGTFERGDHVIADLVLAHTLRVEEVEDLSWIEQHVPQQQATVAEVGEVPLGEGLADGAVESAALDDNVVNARVESVEIALPRTHPNHRWAVDED